MLNLVSNVLLVDDCGHGEEVLVVQSMPLLITEHFQEFEFYKVVLCNSNQEVRNVCKFAQIDCLID